MKLGEKQEAFAESLAWLLDIAHDEGYGVRLQELKRTKEQAQIYVDAGTGILNSVHCHNLAIDLYLTVDGELQWDGEPYRYLGERWKSRTTDDLEHCWGGDFTRRDVYHFSIGHAGAK